MQDFETERLILQPLSIDHRNDYIAMMTDSMTMLYIGDGATLDEQQALLNLNNLCVQNEYRDYGFWAIISKDNNEFVGRVDLYEPNRWPDHELGWMIKRDCWGKGFALEASACIKEFHFSEFKDQKIISYIQPKNKFSINIAESLMGELKQNIVLDSRHYLTYEYKNA